MQQSISTPASLISEPAAALPIFGASKVARTFCIDYSMLSAVRARLVHRCRSTHRNMAHFPLFVNNELREAVDGATIDIEDPATGASIATCATAGPADVAAAVDAAKSAWPAWRDVGAKKRATILRNAAQELRRRVPEPCDMRRARRAGPGASIKHN